MAPYQPLARSIIVDVKLPGMSGPEFVTETKRIRENTPVLHISGCGKGMVKDHYLLSDTVTFLPKPFGYEQLTSAVRRRLPSAAGSP